MKTNGFMRILAIFITGLVLCGVGGGVCIAEWMQLKVVQGADNEVHFEHIYQLPEGEPLYFDQNSDILKVDENVKEGELVFGATYSENYDFEFKPVERCKLAEFDKYGKHKEWTVKGLEMPDWTRKAEAPDDLDYLKQAVSRLKNKEVYVHVDSVPAFEVKINPKDRERVVCVWDHENLELADIDSVIEDRNEYEYDRKNDRNDDDEYYDDDDWEDYLDDMEDREEEWEDEMEDRYEDIEDIDDFD